jgi:hypothetical protein
VGEKRCSTPASKGNPVIVLDKATHQKVSIRQQKEIDPRKMGPVDNIQANIDLLRRMKAEDPASFQMLESAMIDAAEEATLKHASNFRYPK